MTTERQLEPTTTTGTSKTPEEIADEIREKTRVKIRGFDVRVLAVVVVGILALAACGDDGPTAPIIQQVPTLQEPANIAGSWEAVLRSDNWTTGVATMTLIQESSIAVGTWTDPVNGFTGTATVTISEGTKIIAFVSINTCPTLAEFRGDVNSGSMMTWSSDGWSCGVLVAPQGVRLEWNKR